MKMPISKIFDIVFPGGVITLSVSRSPAMNHGPHRTSEPTRCGPRGTMGRGEGVGKLSWKSTPTIEWLLAMTQQIMTHLVAAPRRRPEPPQRARTSAPEAHARRNGTDSDTRSSGDPRRRIWLLDRSRAADRGARPRIATG